MKKPRRSGAFLDVIPVDFCHCQHYADDLSFVGVPIGGGDSAFLCELGAFGDELSVVGEDVDLLFCHGRVVFCFLVYLNIQTF